MDPAIKTNEVTDQSKLLPHKLQELSESCTGELASSYENYQESVFRSLSANFDNNFNISKVNEAYDNLEKCFIENNILTKHGISKFKASASSKLLLQYRDIEDAFADMVFSENAGKRMDGKEMVKKIDLKQFKDEIFPVELCDFPLSDNEDSQSNSEEIEDSESLFGSFQSEAEVSDLDELCENEIPANTDIINSFRSEQPLSADFSQLDKSEAQWIELPKQSNIPDSSPKITCKDVRVVVEKLRKDISNISTTDEDVNSSVILTESNNKILLKESRQVARKRTGGMVNSFVNDDYNLISKEQKIIQQLSSKDGDFVPSVFDKMTRAGKRDLERVLAESTANLVIQKTSQLIPEKIKELPACDNQTNSSSSEDEAAESDIHKTAEIVTNTIIQFLTKTRCRKLEKVGKDISDEISSKLNSLKFGNVAGNVREPQTQTTNKSNSAVEIKLEKSLEKTIKLSNDIEGTNVKRVTRETARKKNTKNNPTHFQDAEAFDESARIQNEMHESLKDSPVGIDRDSNHDEPRRPETRQSKQRQEEVAKNVPDEPRRPETRQSKQKQEDTKNMPDRDSERDEPKRPETRQSRLKQDASAETVSQMVVPKVTVKPTVKSKRRKLTKSKRRKATNKQAGKNLSCTDQVTFPTARALIDGQFLIDSELSAEEPTYCVNNSSPNKILTCEVIVNVCSPFTDATIQKASADSTTLDTTIISSDETIRNDDNFDESNSEQKNEVRQPKGNPVSISTLCTETSTPYQQSSSDVVKVKAENSCTEDGECHGQDENNSQCSFELDNLKPFIGKNESDENINAVDSTNKKLGNVIKEGLLKRSGNPNELKNINLLNEGETLKVKQNVEKAANEKQDSLDDNHSLVTCATTTSVPSQLLHDIIINIEQNIEHNSAATVLQVLGKIASEENAETIADSTSFLNYTLDDSFRLIVDEGAPKKEETESSVEPITNTNLTNGHQNKKSIPELEDDKVLHNKNSDQDINQVKSVDKHVADQPINKINVKDANKHSVLQLENKMASSAKPLTNEEKIARITNRDPRLVNDKKIVNVSIRDPRLRNKRPKLEELQEIPVQPKPPPPIILDSLQSPDPNLDIASIKPSNFEEIIDVKNTSQCEAKTELLDNDLNRRKKFKKKIDEELLYKTPLSDLHASTSVDRPTYVRNIKPKRQIHQVRKDRDVNEDSKSVGQRRNRAVEEPIEERRNEENIDVYNEPPENKLRGRYYNHGSSINDRTVRILNNEEVNHRQEEQYYGRNYERRDYQLTRQQDYQSESRQNYEPEGYARRTSNSERREFSDNQFYSRREFYRRNKYAHDHDHFSNSSRFVEVRQEKPFCSQNDTFAVPDDSIFRISAYPPVSLLPDPMYSQEEDFDQCFSNMDTDSFSPPSSDLCPPPPPQIRPCTPDRLRRESFCPSPPRIGRDSPDRDYEDYNRSFHRNYDRDERSSWGGRNNFSRETINARAYRGGIYRRSGNGRDHRINESPPRKKFGMEHFGRREDERGRWRKSPSCSPDRSRRWSSDRSLSPQEQQVWDRSPPEPHPWDSPPSSVPSRRLHYREPTQSFKNYHHY